MRRLAFTLRYLGRPRWDTGVPPPEIVAYAARHSAGRALDVGCGTGTSAVFLAQSGWQVTGMDFVPLAIRRARQRARSAGVTVDFRIGSVPAFESIHGPFDLALDVGCLHSLDRPARAAYADRMAELLAPGATLLIFAFTSPRPPGIPPDEIDRLFAGTFTLLDRRVDDDGRAAWHSYLRAGPPDSRA